MSPDTADDEASWSVVDAATHGSSTHPGSSQRALWPLEPLVPTAGILPEVTAAGGAGSAAPRGRRG
ncbi:hypothetical protein FGG90_04265 [Clavibacter tessellarius]|uniref:Uncharacterized protein n=1 Tax=Clavibacter tessellarius TaxID=31965 RepID=A0A225CMY5_9MICO|nr:hypothetical protein [Clavibacter michiganensis]OQJ63746.1 hypothetical protein B5P24_12450 [Clavibacter michiganensis subsp. tessellarius]UKF33275.1 hypothetical protein FGG90_04265 [Clavibacter michiganensis subsp. tessellarius]